MEETYQDIDQDQSYSNFRCKRIIFYAIPFTVIGVIVILAIIYHIVH